MISNKVYDVLKFVTMIGLPAASALYVGLSKIWGWPYGTEVAGTVAAVTAFLGVLLGISTNAYNKGLLKRSAYSRK